MINIAEIPIINKHENPITKSYDKLNNYHKILNKAYESKSLNDIAEYLYKLTSQYNKFYAENKVLTEENKEIQESWLILTKIVYNINTLLLDTLSIKVPEKM